jgi:hypothetical protein
MKAQEQFNLDDIDTIEGDGAESELEYYESIQRAINSGMWKLQGSYGRVMMDAIKGGYCMLGRHKATDYYGTTIPSRDDVQEGTKGSYEYVIRLQGQEWADIMGDLI